MGRFSGSIFSGSNIRGNKTERRVSGRIVFGFGQRCLSGDWLIVVPKAEWRWLNGGFHLEEHIVRTEALAAVTLPVWEAARGRTCFEIDPGPNASYGGLDVYP